MRAMTPEEMEAVIRRCKWATICTVSPDGSPYALEATPFSLGSSRCFMINPRGSIWKNIQHNPRVLLKYTLANNEVSQWAGVSCLGSGRFIKDNESMREGWRLLGEVMGEDYSKAAQTFADCKDRIPLFQVLVEKMTGQCSAEKDQPFTLPV